MRRNLILLAGGTVLALSSALVVAQDAPESLLPPGFDRPRPSATRAASPPATPTVTGAAMPPRPLDQFRFR